MKTIEEKAKAYDEAIKVAMSKIKNDKDHVLYEEDITDIFPELKESEGERIRKYIISHFKGHLEKAREFISNGISSPFSAKEIKMLVASVAWLEKEGKKEVKGNNMEIPNSEQKPVDFSDLRTWKYIVDAVWTEKEGIGQYLDSPFTEEVAKKLQKRFGKIEQKSVDKVEPKFHEGDWVVYKNDTCQIVKREEGCNKLVTVFGIEKELVNERNLSTARLWTIQDAKDGDVLEFGDHGRLVTGILSFVNKTTGKVDVSCLLEGSKFKIGVFYNLDTVKPHPATKEQRDLLFQKIKENGYEWDSQKKELKKIGSTWSEKDKEMCAAVLQLIADSEKENGWNCVYCNDKEVHFSDIIAWFNSLRHQSQWKPSDLPHWKKSILPNDNTTGLNSDYFCHKGYNINYKELFEKLPKDD